MSLVTTREGGGGPFRHVACACGSTSFYCVFFLRTAAKGRCCDSSPTVIAALLDIITASIYVVWCVLASLLDLAVQVLPCADDAVMSEVQRPPTGQQWGGGGDSDPGNHDDLAAELRSRWKPPGRGSAPNVKNLVVHSRGT